VNRGKPGPPRSPIEAAFVDDPSLLDRVLKSAWKHVRVEAEVENLSQSCLEHAIRRSRATGEPTPPVTPWMFLGSILNSKGATWRRSQKRKNPGAPFDDKNKEHAGAPAPDAHQVLAAHAERLDMDRVEIEVRTYFAGAGDKGKLPLAILDGVNDDLWTNEDLAKKLECKTTDVENAKERIKHHAARIREKLQSEGGAAA
jgi:hypothetical protein